MLHSAIRAFYGCGLITAPWIIENNFRRPEQIPTAVAVISIVFLITLLLVLSNLYVSEEACRKNFSANRGADHAFRILAQSGFTLSSSCIVKAARCCL